MKTYRNNQYGFQIDIPEEWMLYSEEDRNHPLGKDHMIIFRCGPLEAFNFQIGPLSPEPALEQTENELRRYAQKKGYQSLKLGRLKIESKEHVWALYQMGVGDWTKKYMIVFDEIEYAITATCFDQLAFIEREKVWDIVVKSFHLKQKNGKNNYMDELLKKFSDEAYCYLTTKGRVSGRPHEIEIWFGVHSNVLYLLSGGGEGSDWVKNLLKEPSVNVRIANHTFKGTARRVSKEEEDTTARYMLAEKYQEWEEGKTLSDWARTALPVAIDIHHGD